MTLINKTLYGCPDQETFYDVVDALDMQNMEKIETRYRDKKGVDKKGTISDFFSFDYNLALIFMVNIGEVEAISKWNVLIRCSMVTE